MAQKHTDPYTFLRNLVMRKGRSDVDGVILTAVNVQVDALEDYEYAAVEQRVIERNLAILFDRDRADWDHLLVSTRKNKYDIVHPISFIRGTEPVTIYFLIEDHDISAQVYLPSVTLDEFQYEVMLFQHLLKDVASFAGKIPVSLKFGIGVAIATWDDMVEQGDAQEIEIPG